MANGFKDFLKENATKTNVAFSAIGNLGDLTSSDKKLKGLVNTIKDLALGSVLMRTAFVSAFSGLGSLVKSLAKDTGALEAAMKKVAAVKLYSNQLAPLVGGIAAARSKLADLTVFASKFKLPIGEVVAAQRALIVFSQGALTSGASLEKVKDIAKASGTSIDQAASAYANFHKELKGGAPVAQASLAMQQFGVVSAQAVREATALQEGGASVSEVFQRISTSMEQASSSTMNTSVGLADLQSKLDSAKETMASGFGKPFLEGEKAEVESSIKVIQNLTPVVETLGKTFGAVAGAGAGFLNFIKELLSGIPGLSSVVGVMAKSIAVAAAAISLWNITPALKAIGQLASVVYNAAKAFRFSAIATNMSSASTALNTAATTANSNATLANAAGHKISEMAYKAQAAACAFGAKITAIFGNASLSAAAKVRALTVAMLASPWIIAAAIIIAVAAIWQFMEANAAAAKSLKDLNDANRELSDAMAVQIGQIKTMTDAQEALVKSTSDLHDARVKLAQLQADKAPHEEIQAQKEAVTEAKNRRSRLLKDMEKDKFGGSVERQTALRGVEERKLSLDDEQKDYEISQANPQEKLRLMGERQKELQRRGAAGEALEMDRAKIKEAEGPIDSDIADKRNKIAEEGKAISDLAGKSSSVEYAKKMGDAFRRKALADGATPEEADETARVNQLRFLDEELRMKAGPQNESVGENISAAIAATKNQQKLSGEIASKQTEKDKLSSGSTNEIIAAEAAARKMEAGPEKDKATAEAMAMAKKADPAALQAAREEGRKMEALREQIALSKIQLDSETEIANLKTEGYQRAQDELDIALKRIAAEKAHQEGLGEGKTDPAVVAKLDNDKKSVERQKALAVEQEALSQNALDAETETADIKEEGFERAQEELDIALKRIRADRTNEQNKGTGAVQKEITRLDNEEKNVIRQKEINRRAQEKSVATADLEGRLAGSGKRGYAAQDEAANEKLKSLKDQYNNAPLTAEGMRERQRLDTEAKGIRKSQGDSMVSRAQMGIGVGMELAQQNANIKGDADTAEEIANFKVSKDKYDELISQGVDVPTAKATAKQFGENAISLNAMKSGTNFNSSIAGDSLARIGGGGNVAAGESPELNVAKQSLKNLQNIDKYIVKLAEERKKGELTAL